MGNDNVYSESGHLFLSTTTWQMGAPRVQLVVLFSQLVWILLECSFN